MDHEHIRILIQVVESGSIQGAARRMGMSRSSVRRLLDGLAAEVGAPLLHRDAGGVRLTAAGAVIFDQGQSVLVRCGAMLADARSAAGEPAGVIRMIVPVGMPLSARVQALVATHAAAPKLRLVMREVEDPMAHVHEPCELILHEGPAPEKNGWFSRVVKRMKLCVLASPGYLRARGVPESAEDLAHHDILGWKRPGVAPEVWPLLAGGTVDVSPWITSPDFFFLRTLASRDCGLLLGPVDPSVDEREAEPLVPVLVESIESELVFRASSPHPSKSDSRTRGMLEQVQKALDVFPAD